MASPRKDMPNGPFGPKVIDAPENGRTAHGTEFSSLLAERVKAVRARLGTKPGESVPGWQRVTRRDFAERIGLSERALATRFRRKASAFSAQNLAMICSEFSVRPEYLLLGEGPMLRSDIVDSAAPVKLADALHQHVGRVLGARLEQDSDWADSFLPAPDAFLQGVELGAADILVRQFERHVDDRSIANTSIREAVAIHTLVPDVPDVPAQHFQKATTGLVDGSIIVLSSSKRRSKPPE